VLHLEKPIGMVERMRKARGREWDDAGQFGHYSEASRR
jgi:hypothetical protein